MLLKMVDNALHQKINVSDFSAEWPDLLAEWARMIEKEYPKTADKLLTGDIGLTVDGYEYGIATPTYFKALQHDYDEVMKIYESEKQSAD